ncbi:hypothetical protein COCC4DRAFT_59561 [Bipolaris maydis ATCC 48331]|uniref:Ornithine aminotransferase n=2 Tax=Cochliobolus heterostrophus TaxID=5016 RepID=M2UI67_COCH5|nr:uncharacterized protein COCC4DRAFT_59561 [Bipolaris maydis ATCC 48331]EMD87698.1 hypothetical protein COCHEDRAFT_1217853 [Bipolaris maydis C5]KAJ5023041.1 pyridoxal phosphate-dependent transferase [Bipolaris maydis]ENI06898.1 hypothetical protein COCC4DRAFT_59561 [Bipolaris maydis ATCC 48331]KAJ5056213.1 pyridoxal phosphate-dependent transferase [Bipolaris maydis]KAJ6193958.1 pyridoxal phosphate-dependent transferase [Bipolaris maydis]
MSLHTSTHAIADEERYSAHNYVPLSVIFARARGVNVWNPEDKHYCDPLSVLAEQAGRLTLSSRGFYNDVFPQWAKLVNRVFGHDMVLSTCTGAEAVETAIKITRKRAYKVKGVAQDEAYIFGASQNFHGRTMTAITLSVDPLSRTKYGPHVPRVGACNPTTGQAIQYNNTNDLRDAFEEYSHQTAAFICGPIQREAGVVVPDDEYLVQVSALCKKHNVPFICDEIHTGTGRTDRMLCHQWTGIKPDLVTVGKALSGGMYPVNCILGDTEVMSVIKPETHGSTFGGNPLGCAVSIRALELIEEEELITKAGHLGQILREGLQAMDTDAFRIIRGKGLLNAVLIDDNKTNGWTAWDLCLAMRDRDLLAKPAKGDTIRFAPPLVITETELRKDLAIIRESIKALSSG